MLLLQAVVTKNLVSQNVAIFMARVAGGARAQFYDEESVHQIHKSLVSATKAHGGIVNAVEALARFISGLPKDAAAAKV